MHIQQPKPGSAWAIVKRNKLELATGTAFGLAILAGAKYLAAIFLIFWLLAGGQ